MIPCVGAWSHVWVHGAQSHEMAPPPSPSLPFPVCFMQENDQQLLERINTADELPDHIIKELEVARATVTPWWWGLKTLLKVVGTIADII